MIEVLLFVGAALLVILAGFMTALDAALGVTSTSDLIDLAAKGRSSRSLARIAKDRDVHEGAVTFLRVLCDAGATVLAATAFSLLLESAVWGIVITVLVMSAVVYIVVSSAPSTLGRRYAEGVLVFGAPAMRFSRYAFGFVSGPLAALSTRAIPGGRRRGFESEEQLLSIVDEAASHSLIEDDDRELIHSVFDFTDQIVRAVMVPRTEMVSIESGATAAAAMDEFLTSGLSRLPVIDGDVDDVVGVLYLKDLVQHAFRATPGWRDAAVRAYARPAVFVPEQMRAEALLQQMKTDQVHVCLVIDEYGGIAGIVTLEDLLEELVGEIDDEYDARSNEIVELPDGSFRVSAGLGLDEVGDLFGIDIEDEDVDSVGGLLSKQLGHVPQPGEQAEVLGLVLTGGTSRGRGRGIATVFVDRSEALRAVDDALGRNPRTGEVALPALATSERAEDSSRRSGRGNGRTGTRHDR